MNKLRLTRVLATAAVALPVFLLLCAADAPTTQPAGPLDRFKAMAGEWKGVGNDGKPVTMTSQVSSNGSAVVETLHMHGDMVTVYHIDGDKLMLTHYCAVGNQPRMRAASAEGKAVQFNFVDATNLPDPNQPHMHDLKITFVDPDHVTQEWTLFTEGKPSYTEKLAFERVK